MTQGNKDNAHLSVLDGLRGVAALWVMTAHCQIWGGWYWWRMPDPKIAVDVFMVLSGFLMVHQWHARGELVTPSSVGRFYLRRFFRIAPLYYMVLIVTFIIQKPFLEGYASLRAANPQRWAEDFIYDPNLMNMNVNNFWMHLTFLFGASPYFSFSDFLPDWSISLEMHFYAVFPFLLLAFRRIGPLATAALSLLACSLVGRYLPVFPEPSALPLKLSVFIVGMLTAEAAQGFRVNSRRSVLLALAAALIAPRDSRITLGVAILLYIVAVDEPGSRLRVTADRFLGNSVARFLGETSYSVYLIHGFFISLAGGWFFRQAGFLSLDSKVRVAILTAVTATGSYSLGWILFRSVERYGIQVGRRLSTNGTTHGLTPELPSFVASLTELAHTSEKGQVTQPTTG